MDEHRDGSAFEADILPVSLEKTRHSGSLFATLNRQHLILAQLILSRGAAPMVYKLTLQNDVQGLGQKRWVFTPPAVAGRDPSSQLCMEHDSISRKHCQFSLNSDGALVVKDLESMNGTYVDDSRVQHTTLMPGQLIQIGALRLKIDFSGDEEPTPPPLKKSQGNVYATQPMDTFRPVPLPPEKSWWQKLLGR